MNRAFDPQKGRFRLNPRYRLQWEEAQQCHVLLYPEGLIKLNGSAAEILERCREPVSAADLIATLQQTFPDAQGLAGDVNEFLEHAADQEWIVPEQEKT
ncbi:MAG: pyrroloquinoline quinone biosynthesis peptide chaperone PqqD [Pseudohongiellaceae bacterium]